MPNYNEYLKIIDNDMNLSRLVTFSTFSAIPTEKPKLIFGKFAVFYPYFTHNASEVEAVERGQRTSQ